MRIALMAYRFLLAQFHKYFYSFDAKDFNTGYTNAPFYNDKNDSVAYVCNAMWHMFGAVDDGQSLVYRFGNEPTYFEGMSEERRRELHQ